MNAMSNWYPVAFDTMLQIEVRSQLLPENDFHFRAISSLILTFRVYPRFELYQFLEEKLVTNEK